MPSPTNGDFCDRSGPACDIGAFERSGVFANQGPAEYRRQHGLRIRDRCRERLCRRRHRHPDAGRPANIVGNPIKVDVGGSSIAATFDFTGRPTGAWNVVVRNPNKASKTLPAGFAIEAGPAQNLGGRHGAVLPARRPSRITILYGNRGNVDAVAVPLSLSIPAGYAPVRHFAADAATATSRDRCGTTGARTSPTGATDVKSGFVDIPLLLPLVPSGFTGVLQIGLTHPVGAEESLLVVALGDPMFNAGLDPGLATRAVAGARAYLQANGVACTSSLVPELEHYVTNQFQHVAEDGRAAYRREPRDAIANLHSMSHLTSIWCSLRRRRWRKIRKPQSRLTVRGARRASH